MEKKREPGIKHESVGPFCQCCHNTATSKPHYEVVLINGYPAPCPNNGKLFFDTYYTLKTERV